MSSYRSKHTRSVCKTLLSVVELIAGYKAASCAKILTLDFTCSGRSVMYERKRIVPRTEPCGTPEETEILSEFIPLIPSKCAYMSPIWASNMGSATGLCMGPIWVIPCVGCPDGSHITAP